MSAEEKAKFRLDDNLGGNSTVHNHAAITRLYGDKAPDVIEGLKKSPVIAVPLVLKRLKTKEEEWRKAKKLYNKAWRDQCDKHYLRSLDHQGITFKPTDVKMLRSKSLVNEIENISEERHEQADDGMEVSVGPHMRFSYKNKDQFKDAANLIIRHVKRQTGIHKEEKQKIKQLIRQFVPDLFCVPRGELSDDEVDKDDDMDMDDFNEDSKSPMPGNSSPRVKKDSEQKERVPPVDKPAPIVSRTFSEEEKESRDKLLLCNFNISTMENLIPGDAYALFFANNNWYIFFRLHHILCERLHKIQERSRILTIEEMRDREERLQSTAIALRLKSKTNVDVESYYSTFLDMVKSLLDGNIESNQYEDTLREMFGIDAYVGFTVDKIIQNIVRQLQHLVGDDICTTCMSMFLEEQKCDGAGGLCATASQRVAFEAVYQKKAETHLTDDNCFKVILYKNEAKFTIELIDAELDQSEGPTASPRWTGYMDHELPGEDTPNILKERSKTPVYLRRNTRWRRNMNRRPMDKNDADSDPCKIDFSALEDSAAGDAVKGLVGLNPGKAVCRNEYVKASEDDACLSTLCRFDVNQYKILYVANNDSSSGDVLMYKHLSLGRARQSHGRVSEKLNGKFHCWHNKWLKDNVLEEESKKCQSWLLGHTEDSVLTQCVKVDNPLKPPYAVFNRYRIQDVT